MGQIIPEAAVEAAAKAIHEAGGFYEWEDPEGWREKSATHEARAALEAAAPIMRADTLREAASVVASEEGEQWRRAAEHLPGAQIAAQRMRVVARVISGRAEDIRPTP